MFKIKQEDWIKQIPHIFWPPIFINKYFKLSTTAETLNTGANEYCPYTYCNSDSNKITFHSFPCIN